MGRRPMCLLCLLFMAFLCLTDWLGMPLIKGNPLPDRLKSWVSRHPEASVCGEVERCTETEFSQSIYLKQACLIYKSEKVSIENVRVFLKTKERVPAGTLLVLSGTLQEVEGPRNPGEFDSRQYYACRHIYYFLKKAVIIKKSNNYSGYGQFLLDMQEKFARVLEQTTGEHAPVFSAVVLGDKSGLDTETKMRYQMAGIIHMLAISGLHISVLGMGLYQILKRVGLGIWPSGMISLVIMLQYGMMTGGSVSTMRAVCMFLLSVGAKILGRIYDMMTALSVAAILILLESPAYLYSSSFLLSFGAVLGIGAAAPALCTIAGLDRVAKGAGEKLLKAFLSSFAVQAVTLPVVLTFYGEVSVAGILLNLIVLPTVGVVLASGVGAVLTGIFCISAGRAAALPGRALLILYGKLCELAGRIPFCTWIGGQPKWWQVMAFYSVLGIILALGYLARKKDSKRKLLALGSVFLFAGGILLLAPFPSKELRVTCLDVGQGDGCVIELPEGYCFLIDGGSSNKAALGQYQLLPYLKSRGISYLDGILISHTDEDHISGVRELLEFMGKGLTTVRAGALILPGWTEKPQAYMELEKAAEKAGVKVIPGNTGDIFQAGEVKLTLLAPEKGQKGGDVNEEGMVVQLDYGEFQGLFTGDIGEKSEKLLMERLVDVDFLKVGHHGSRYSSSTAFLEKIKPETAVISCSSTNTYGHPSDETINRLEDAGAKVEYTMKSGAVTVITDGKRMRVERFKQK
ncbi:MAG: DNA internalization-related competence protein ComEC/Rec2 [Eubacteriales bacterium]|nr:DNA internalization-related competence protein ComEC/Rec2 [Eubacteriales bacterium]